MQKSVEVREVFLTFPGNETAITFLCALLHLKKYGLFIHVYTNSNSNHFRTKAVPNVPFQVTK